MQGVLKVFQGSTGKSNQIEQSENCDNVFSIAEV